jgi:hypothetical protein
MESGEELMRLIKQALEEEREALSKLQHLILWVIKQVYKQLVVKAQPMEGVVAQAEGLSSTTLEAIFKALNLSKADFGMDTPTFQWD